MTILAKVRKAEQAEADARSRKKERHEADTELPDTAAGAGAPPLISSLGFEDDTKGRWIRIGSAANMSSEGSEAG